MTNNTLFLSEKFTGFQKCAAKTKQHKYFRFELCTGPL